ncbi:MAG: cell division protein ZapA [Firmicutes bacterium]|nr:cell division protein ZapA [Bacillota bacterium]
MTLYLDESAELGPEELRVRMLGHTLRLHSREGEGALRRAVEVLEQTFRDMEEAYRVRWGHPPTGLDTSTWILMGALNLAHRSVTLEQEASQQTQDLEQKLAQLLDDVPDDSPAPGPLFPEEP